MGEDDDFAQHNLTSLDKENLDVLKPQLDAIGISLPDPVLEQIAVLGRESDVREGTFVSYELDQIHVCERYAENLKSVFFQDVKEIKIRFKGEDHIITEQTLLQDIKYMILLNDIGKAGWDEESRQVVPKIYNNIQMKKGVHDAWLKSHKEEVISVMQESGVSESVSTETLQTFQKAVEAGDFMNLPVSVMVEVSRRVAQTDPQKYQRSMGLELTPSDIEILAKGGADPRKTTMREFFDKHVEWGEKFLETHVTDKRTMMLATLGLMHHYTQDYLPASYKSGQLEVQGDALRIVAWIQLLDMADGLIKRSSMEPEKLGESVLSLAHFQKRSAEANGRVALLEDISEYFDWTEVGKLLMEREATEKVDLKDQSERIGRKKFERAKTLIPKLVTG